MAEPVVRCAGTSHGNRCGIAVPRFAPIDWRRLEELFLRSGFRFVRQEGSHRSYVRDGTPRPVVIPTYKEVPVFVIRANLKTAGITRDEYFRHLDKIG